eukprot:TRINITY_DN7633_c0_g1_i1.p1 TRINITY_DN7633_c0_g1~~TRINITY_DN7633_c0_g1_i1.p1  ORF type:complete len:692 (+),score=200.13 TRINITY_DN7633_c0_g1_i1:80-2155(+)
MEADRKQAPQELEAEEEWKSFIAQLSQEENYQKLVDAPCADASQLGVEVSRLCWNSCRETQEKLKKRLAELNLSSLKQVSILKTKAPRFKAIDLCSTTSLQNEVEFYEPLQFLDETTRELVLNIIEEKVEQMVEGNAAPWLLRAVGLNSNGTDAEGTLQPRSKKPLKERLAESEEQVESLQINLANAERKLAAAREDLRSSQDLQQSHEAQLATANAQVAHLRAENARQATEISQRTAEVEAARGKLDFRRAELRRQRSELGRQAEEIESLHEKLARALGERDGQRGRLGDMETELSSRLAELEACREQVSSFDERRLEDEAEIKRLQEENLQLRQLARVKEENKRLKAMLEELQLKTRDLMRKLKRAGLEGEVMGLCVNVGLDSFAKGRNSAFQRLYDDAMARIERLQKLRGIYAETERPEFHIAARPAFEQAIEESTLESDFRLDEPKASPRRQTQVSVIIAPPPLPPTAAAAAAAATPADTPAPPATAAAVTASPYPRRSRRWSADEAAAAVASWRPSAYGDASRAAAAAAVVAASGGEVATVVAPVPPPPSAPAAASRPASVPRALAPVTLDVGLPLPPTPRALQPTSAEAMPQSLCGDATDPVDPQSPPPSASAQRRILPLPQGWVRVAPAAPPPPPPPRETGSSGHSSRNGSIDATSSGDGDSLPALAAAAAVAAAASAARERSS